MNSYETSISVIELIQPDVVRIKTKEGVIINQRGMEENLKVYKEIIPNGAFFLSVFHISNTTDKSVKSEFESPERIKLKKAEAFVLHGLSNRIELEYHINKTRKLYPTQVFEDEQSALEWFEELRIC